MCKKLNMSADRAPPDKWHRFSHCVRCTSLIVCRIVWLGSAYPHSALLKQHDPDVQTKTRSDILPVWSSRGIHGLEMRALTVYGVGPRSIPHLFQFWSGCDNLSLTPDCSNLTLIFSHRSADRTRLCDWQRRALFSVVLL